MIGDQKFGRTDASSPVPTSLNQTVTLPQAHLQQQAFINATTMPHPYGYGGLAFYPGAGMMAGGFPAYTTPMYQVLVQVIRGLYYFEVGVSKWKSKQPLQASLFDWRFLLSPE